MAVTTCVVSGVVKDPSGAAISSVTIKAIVTRPWLYSSTGDLILNDEVSTTSSSTGTWSLTLAETTTDGVTMTISFEYPGSSLSSKRRQDYTVTIPAQSSVNFNTLISGQA